MATVDPKTTIFTVLKQQGRAVSLKELLSVLGEGYAERSVRRWLSQMAHEGKIVKTGQKRATRYQVIASEFSEAAKDAIEYVHQPIFERRPVAYNEAWLLEYIPNTTFYLSEANRAKMQQKGERDLEDDVAGTYARKIYNRLLIDLSYNSSRLEGNTYSLLDTEKLIIEGAAVSGKLDEETVMILNHKDTIRHLVEEAARLTIDYNEICTLHYLLSDGLIEPRYSGKVRDHGVRIGSSTYIPIEGQDRLERQLVTICQTAAQIHNPYEQSFFLLVHIAYLQAFADVNKRTSRLAANIPLIKSNVVPLSFNHVEKADYISAIICVYELNDVRPLSEIYHYSYLRSCRSYDVAAEMLGFDEVRIKYRQVRRQIIRHIILEQLIGERLTDFINTQTQQIGRAHV